MKTYLVVGVVIAAHCVAIGSAVLMQGCGTTPVEEFTMDPVPVGMPPVAGEETILPEVFPSPVVLHGTASSPSLPKTPSVYVIKKGDSLSSIAQQHGVSLSELVALNKIKNPNMIRSGQRLVLPGRGTSSVKASAVRVKAEPVKASVGCYIVKRGDSLSGIAAKHGTTVAKLRAANGIDGDTIYAGKEIVIPGGSSKPATKRLASPLIDARVSRKNNASVAEELLEEVPPQPAESDWKAPKAVKIRKITVQKNEDLTFIARRWAVSVDDLKRINKLGDDPIIEGQILSIPIEF